MADDESFPLPTDVFVAILTLLPTSCRRRLRLVCKSWRSIVDERTPERQVRTKVLAFISKRRSSRALVLDDGRRRREWTFPSGGGVAGVVEMVGTCNGLLCLHETAPCGDRGVSVLTVANPLTGETRRLPPLPPARTPSSRGLYVFGYHPITGRYKVVHIPPSSSTWPWMLDAVQVHVLGELTWREVPVRLGASYNHSCGAVSVDGSVYWLAARADRVMALDLDDEERVAFFDAPPTVRPVKASSAAQAACRLTNVQARLGVVVTRHDEPAPAPAKVDVWVRDGGWWSRWYTVVEPSVGPDRWRWVTAPHFTYGEYVLGGSSLLSKRRLYRCKVRDMKKGGGKDKAQVGPAELIMSEEFYGALTTFAYVETHEPLPSIIH